MVSSKKKRRKIRLSASAKTPVLLNGRLVGDIEEPKKVIEKLKQERRNSQLPCGTNFFYNKGTNELIINSDSGRARRPYIIVENGKSRLTPSCMNS